MAELYETLWGPVDSDGDRNPQLEEALRERDAWTETARLAMTNIEFYRGLLNEVAMCLGPEVCVSDDGTVNDAPLMLKIPPLVRKLVGLSG